jgi:hypothetical protein
MPTFYVDNIDIEPYEYVKECSYSDSDIKELIKELVDAGHLPPSVKNMISKKNKEKPGFHPSESIYEEAIDKLHGKYTSLSQEDEETILKIANKL